MNRTATRGSQPDSETRRRMIDAAISCILDRGFYRASSNEIARYADMSWGVIQYHFGTRDRLMLAVLQEGAEEFVELIGSAEVVGDTVVERFESLMDVMFQHYGSREYLARIQILLNLHHDPKTSDEVRATLAELSERSYHHVHRLLGQILGPDHRDGDVETTIFLLIRGFAISEQLLSSMAYDTPPDAAPDAARSLEQHRATLVRLVAPFLREATGER